MLEHSSKPKARKRFKNKQERLFEYCDVTAYGQMVDELEFLRTLDEAQFIPKAVEACRTSALEKFHYYRLYGISDISLSEFEEDFQRRSAFLLRHLPNWFFRITSILALEARFASRGEPISKASVRRLFEIIFVDREFGGPPLKDCRNEIWDAPTLKFALREVLPQIKVESAVTLENVAQKINAIEEPISYRDRKKPLTGKHLQKLFSDHDINWKRIKKDYLRTLKAAK